jgi:hypothetical protein
MSLPRTLGKVQHESYQPAHPVSGLGATNLIFMCCRHALVFNDDIQVGLQHSAGHRLKLPGTVEIPLAPTPA